MAATIWKGAISFGLVNIPVDLQSAVRSHDLSFKLLREDGLCPVKYERVCTKDGEAVPWAEIVKGYEYEKGRYVVITDEDFKEAALATSKSFDIQGFVGEAEIDPRFYEKPYYLVPQSGGEKAYALLREAMRKSGSVGIGTITIRQKQRLAAIKPVGDALVLDLMRFADEVVDEGTERFPSADELRPQELKMAEQLIENLTEEFQPEQYKDQYRANLLKIIEAKTEGRSANLEEAAEPDTAGVIDLMARLQESLEQNKKPAAKKSKRSGGKSTARKKKTA